MSWRSKQTEIGIFLLVINIILLMITASQSSYNFAISWGLGLLFGFVFQRSRFCTVAAIRDVFLLRNFALAKGVLLYISLASALFSILYIISQNSSLEIYSKLEPIGILTVIGAFIFGIGMVIAGGCASGTLIRMGEGLIMQWWGFLGLISGILLGTWQYPLYKDFNIGLQEVFIPDYLGLPLTLTLQFGIFASIYAIFRWIEHKDQYYTNLANYQKTTTTNETFTTKITNLIVKPWSYTTGAVALAILSSIVFLWKQFWGISNGLAHLFAGLTNMFITDVSKWEFFAIRTTNDQLMFLKYPLVPLVVAMVFGSFISSLLAKEFRIRRTAHIRYTISAVAGGFLMGIGARIANGCNVSAVMSGIPSFSLHGWVFLVFMTLGVIVGIKILTRYLVV